MTEQQKPVRFHIMVPVYRVERYLNACVESVLGQTYGNFILYLIDDGSPDSCPALCDAFAQRDPRVRVIHKENGGAFQSRICGLAMAWERTPGPEDYAAFLDSDDELVPHALETIAGVIRRRGCDCVIYDAETFGEGETVQRVGGVTEERLVTDRREVYDLTLKPSGNYNALWRKAVRLSLLTHDPETYAPYYHVTVREDRLHSLEIYRKSRSVCFIPDVLYRYRMNPASIMHTAREEEYLTDFTIYEPERVLLASDPEYAGAPFAAYHGARIRQVMGEMASLAGRGMSYRRCAALYRRVRAAAYWQDFLSQPGYDKQELGRMSLLYRLFRWRWDWAVWLIGRVHWRPR